MNPLDTMELFSIELMNPNPSSSKTKDGPKYRVSFEMDKDDWQMFMDANTSGMVLEFQGRVQQSNGQVIAKEYKEGHEELKGGPVSKNAAIFEDTEGDKIQEFAKVQGFDSFKAMIYSACGITSRRYLDHDPAAKEGYEKLKHRYFRWAAQ